MAKRKKMNIMQPKFILAFSFLFLNKRSNILLSPTLLDCQLISKALIKLNYVNSDFSHNRGRKHKS